MTDVHAAPVSARAAPKGFLISGAEYLARHPGFHLVGRDDQLKALYEVIMQEDGENNLILTGEAGVGATSLLMGLEERKDDSETPFDIAGKNYYWLDTDSLFSSGDAETVRKNFQDVLDTLTDYSDSSLIIQNAREFIELTKNDDYSYFINALVLALENKKLQAFLECRPDDLDKVYDCHPNIRQIFKQHEVKEPGPQALKVIIDEIADRMEQKYKVSIAPETRAAAISLTQQYPAATQVNRAQPDLARALLSLSLARVLQHAHSTPAGFDGLKEKFDAVTKRIEGGESDSKLAQERSQLQDQMAQATAGWNELRRQIRLVQSDRHEQERAINDLRHESGEFDDKRKTELQRLQETLAAKKREYAQLVEGINKRIILEPEHVLETFNAISHIPVTSLNQDEITRLKMLENMLSARVTGQPEPIQAVANAVRIGRQRLKKPDEPIGSFMFLGPSGAGKTELAKVLAYLLFGDENALQRYDMSTYNKEGGVEQFMNDLRRNMRERPYCVNVFDEIEKGPPGILELFLPVMDDGRIKDSRGIVTSFGHSIDIVTSNIGQEYFYDKELSYEQASEKAMEELRKTYRNESLNRFMGIYCFHPLEVEQVEIIAGKRLEFLGRCVADRNLTINMPPADMDGFCREHFERQGGSRSVLNVVKTEVAGAISDVMLDHPGESGEIKVSYDPETKKVNAALKPSEP